MNMLENGEVDKVAREYSYTCSCECSSDPIHVKAPAHDLAETEAYRIFSSYVALGDARANCTCTCRKKR